MPYPPLMGLYDEFGIEVEQPFSSIFLSPKENLHPIDQTYRSTIIQASINIQLLKSLGGP